MVFCKGLPVPSTEPLFSLKMFSTAVQQRPFPLYVYAIWWHSRVYWCNQIPYM